MLNVAIVKWFYRMIVPNPHFRDTVPLKEECHEIVSPSCFKEYCEIFFDFTKKSIAKFPNNRCLHCHVRAIRRYGVPVILDYTGKDIFRTLTSSL